MQRALLCGLILGMGAAASAGDGGPVTGSLSGSSTFVSGPTGPAFNPTLELGARGTVQAALSPDLVVSGSWGLTRAQVFCDTCGDGEGPRTGGSATGQAVDTTDLRLSASKSWSDRLATRLDGTLPASRDALVCNPFYGAIGAGVRATQPIAESALHADAAGSRALFRHAAPPVGRCAVPLRDYAGTATLAGTVTPSAPRGFSRSPNTAWSLAAGLTWTDPHRLVVQKARRLGTAFSLGWNHQRRRQDGATMVATLSGPVAIGAAHVPGVNAFPASLTASWDLRDRLDLSLTLANTTPAVLDDPGAHVRNLPGRTAVRLALTGAL